MPRPEIGSLFSKKTQKLPQKTHFSALSSDCHNLTLAVCIFMGARFYADDIPYSFGNFGPFRGWRRRGCLRHHLAVESAAIPDYRGDCGVAGVLRRVKRNFSAFFQKCCKKRLYYATFLTTFGQYSTIPKNKNKPSGKTKKSPISG